ncbi:MAG: DUF4115 domain-containing protein [Ostreibacterium sp.]
MTFSEKCWLRIKDADGEVLTSGFYSANRPLDITGKPPFSAKIGLSSAVKILLLNDQPLRLADLNVSKMNYKIQ